MGLYSGDDDYIMGPSAFGWDGLVAIPRKCGISVMRY